MTPVKMNAAPVFSNLGMRTAVDIASDWSLGRYIWSDRACFADFITDPLVVDGNCPVIMSLRHDGSSGFCKF